MWMLIAYILYCILIKFALKFMLNCLSNKLRAKVLKANKEVFFNDMLDQYAGQEIMIMISAYVQFYN